MYTKDKPSEAGIDSYKPHSGTRVFVLSRISTICISRESEAILAKENREHKSSVFADLFYYDESAKKNLLDLHNALYGTAYSDPGVVDLIGLEDVLFRTFKKEQ